MSDSAVMELHVVREATPAPTLEDAVAASERDLAEAARLRDSVAASLLTYADYADVLKLMHEDWLTSSHPNAQLIRQIEEMRSKVEQPVPAAVSATMTSDEAAQRLRMVKPDGRPTDKFRAQVLPLIGTKYGRITTVHTAKVEAFERGELA